MYFNEISTNLMKTINPEIQETQRMGRTRNMKRTTPRHMIFKLLKINDKQTILKVPREKQRLYYRGTKIRVKVDYLSQTMKARGEWSNIFKVLKN